MSVGIIDCFGYAQLPADLQHISKPYSELAHKIANNTATLKDHKDLLAKIKTFPSDKAFMTDIAQKRLIPASNVALSQKERLISLWESKNAAVMAAVKVKK